MVESCSLPWQGKVLAGTTDTPLKKVPENPVPTEEEIQDILNEMQNTLFSQLTEMMFYLLGQVLDH